MYLWMVYHSAAEPLPNDFRHGLGKPQDLNETPFPEHRQDDDQVTRHVSAFMQNLHVYESDVDVRMIGPGTFKGERRHLQHGSRIELYFEYIWPTSSRKERRAHRSPHSCGSPTKFWESAAEQDIFTSENRTSTRNATSASC